MSCLWGLLVAYFHYLFRVFLQANPSRTVVCAFRWRSYFPDPPLKPLSQKRRTAGVAKRELAKQFDNLPVRQSDRICDAPRLHNAFLILSNGPGVHFGRQLELVDCLNTLVGQTLVGMHHTPRRASPVVPQTETAPEGGTKIALRTPPVTFRVGWATGAGFHGVCARRGEWCMPTFIMCETDCNCRKAATLSALPDARSYK